MKERYNPYNDLRNVADDPEYLLRQAEACRAVPQEELDARLIAQSPLMRNRYASPDNEVEAQRQELDGEPAWFKLTMLLLLGALALASLAIGFVVGLAESAWRTIRR